MIRLKNKPGVCGDCPFCYQSEGFVRSEGKIQAKTDLRCGVLMDNADYSRCPLS